MVIFDALLMAEHHMMPIDSLTVITVFMCIFVICSKKWPQNTYWPVFTYPDNKHTWEMDHFWCTSDDWTLSLVTGQVWTVNKAAKGMLLFVKNDTLPNTCWIHLPFPTPNNIITWKMDHFYTLQWMGFVPFQNSF